MNKIQPITKEMIDSLPFYERKPLIKKYQDWVKSARKCDKLQINREHNRVWSFLFRKNNPEKYNKNIKKWRKNYYLKHRDLRKGLGKEYILYAQQRYIYMNFVFCEKPPHYDINFSTG